MATKKTTKTKQKNGKTITVYEALSLRKLYENKLDDLITFGDSLTTPYVGCYTGEKTEEIKLSENKMKSNYDKFVALLRNIDELTSKINESNAITTVTIDGVVYTKAEAIYRYQNISTRISLYERLDKSITAMQEHITKNNNNASNSRVMDERVKNMLSAISSSGDENLLAGKTIVELMDDCKKSIVENESMKLLDPYKLVEKVPEELEKLRTFQNRFNLEMNKSNLSTEITVDLED